jgi:hypothetical protein
VVADGPWSIHIVKIDRERTDFEFTTTLAKGSNFGLSTLTEQIKVLPAEWGHPVAAINGDFWNEHPKYPGDPKGLQIHHGELVSTPSDRPSFWIDPAGKPQIGTVTAQFKVIWPNGATTPFGINEEREYNTAVLYTPTLGPSTRTTGGHELVLESIGSVNGLPLRAGQTYVVRVREVRDKGDSPISRDAMVLSLGPQLVARLPRITPGMELKISTASSPDLSGVTTAIGGGPVLVHGGKAMEWKPPPPRHPRTAIGWNEKYLFLVEVDGRQAGLSVGMTFPELADYLVKLGCEEALNLDGGASTTMWVYGQVMNSPSAGHERNMANALVLMQKEKR